LLDLRAVVEARVFTEGEKLTLRALALVLSISTCRGVHALIFAMRFGDTGHVRHLERRVFLTDPADLLG
jgi:hypothetical protein